MGFLSRGFDEVAQENTIVFGEIHGDGVGLSGEARSKTNRSRGSDGKLRSCFEPRTATKPICPATFSSERQVETNFGAMLASGIFF